MTQTTTHENGTITCDATAQRYTLANNLDGRSAWSATYTVVGDDAVRIEIISGDGYVAPRTVRLHKARESYAVNVREIKGRPMAPHFCG
jgi:hypothetical protein